MEKGREGEELNGRYSLQITISPWLSLLKYKRMTLLIQLRLLLRTFSPALPHIWSHISTFKSMCQAQGRKAAEYLGTGCFFVNSMRYFETELCLLKAPFPFSFWITFTFFPTFIIWTQVNLILTIKPTLLCLLSWLLFGKLFHSHI